MGNLIQLCPFRIKDTSNFSTFLFCLLFFFYQRPIWAVLRTLLDATRKPFIATVLLLVDNSVTAQAPAESDPTDTV